jgi:hypothetical protein
VFVNPLKKIQKNDALDDLNDLETFEL